MDLVKGATILIAFVVIYQVLIGGKRENMATAWFPYSYLNNISKGIKDNQMVESFNSLSSISSDEDSNIIQEQGFNPNKNIISEYSINEIMPNDSDKNKLQDIQLGDLETSEFGTFEPEMNYADLLEVNPNNAGSGDLSDLKDSYKNFNGNLYFNTLEMLNKRGGNAVVAKSE